MPASWALASVRSSLRRRNRQVEPLPHEYYHTRIVCPARRISLANGKVWSHHISILPPCIIRDKGEYHVLPPGCVPNIAVQDRVGLRIQEYDIEVLGSWYYPILCSSDTVPSRTRGRLRTLRPLLRRPILQSAHSRRRVLRQDLLPRLTHIGLSNRSLWCLYGLRGLYGM